HRVSQNSKTPPRRLPPTRRTFFGKNTNFERSAVSFCPSYTNRAVHNAGWQSGARVVRQARNLTVLQCCCSRLAFRVDGKCEFSEVICLVGLLPTRGVGSTVNG